MTDNDIAVVAVTETEFEAQATLSAARITPNSESRPN